MKFPRLNLLNRLDQIVRPIAIPNLTVSLVICQVVFWAASMLNPMVGGRAVLIWNRVLDGEVWRVFSFMLLAPVGSPLFAIFYFYIFYMMGTFLEQAWGYVRFNAFIYLGVLLNILASVAVPNAPINGAYLEATIFLAFATLNPNFSFLLMFILPVKVKYLAWLQAAFYLLQIVSGPIAVKLMVIASLGNYLIFFGADLVARGFGFHRRLQRKTKLAASTGKLKHVCSICGVDSERHRNIEFRYCTKCVGTPAYCEHHLRNHEHITQEEVA